MIEMLDIFYQNSITLDILDKLRSQVGGELRDESAADVHNMVGV